jgi:hypothetical protein
MCLDPAWRGDDPAPKSKFFPPKVAWFAKNARNFMFYSLRRFNGFPLRQPHASQPLALKLFKPNPQTIFHPPQKILINNSLVP